MAEIKTMNKIAQQGLDVLAKNGHVVNVDAENPEGLLIRSAKLHDMEFGDRLLAIARAGVGTDNVPVDRCTEAGIAVFNTAGANAEAVKELAICALMLASRDIAGGIEWVRSIAGHDNVAAEVEKGKAAFVGPEICGKSLGIIGLGAIGSLVANAALSLGMTVWGYDPYLSVDAAWRLRSEVKHAADLDTIFRESDYLMVQVHCNDETRGMINAAAISKMKPGVRIINLARGELIDDNAMLSALSCGKVARYITDFPNNKLVGVSGVVATPHLGASTPESEDKCAVMAAEELNDYLENGNLKNSVNLPNVSLARAGVCRLCVIHRNVPKMLNRFLDLIAAQNINVEHMINKSRGNVAYTIIDAGAPLGPDITEAIAAMEEVLRVRVLS
ncbi:MAG: phosphoglycerate dehydrogenase [Oscillospiraceae bacterium]|nr:phosphoglycerate dehydrogenase [Oscillospiraceae bacterium]MCD7852440.1 phosphoglycerate dehydrogenase [Oscillospiraceae bacterium]